uniref:Protein sleepless n=1 Tax=Timema cristinae TaxID=61476 RepID=A0A7R9H0P5_TIMCR|nr:unnamed protein product [Timema cristinae]
MIHLSVLVGAEGYFGILKRCFACRSRGDLGSCKDPFKFNSTLAQDERGLEAVPCASGWCGKFMEGGTTFKDDDYGVATQRMCLQRAPNDNEERCAYTVWGNKKVYMCFCQGDLCNTAGATPLPPFMLVTSLAALVAYISKKWFNTTNPKRTHRKTTLLLGYLYLCAPTPSFHIPVTESSSCMISTALGTKKRKVGSEVLGFNPEPPAPLAAPVPVRWVKFAI